jgi:hypothetical protein
VELVLREQPTIRVGEGPGELVLDLRQDEGERNKLFHIALYLDGKRADPEPPPPPPDTRGVIDFARERRRRGK